MKLIKLFSGVLVVTFILFNIFCSLRCQCASSQMERPQYEITVTQGETELGKIVLETFPEEAPKHAANFDSLVNIGFFDGTAFHRVIPGFMIQGGDPNTKNFPNDRSK